MPFTPLHMGPAIAIKALLQKRFSLMVFGWSQIIIDLQPLIVIITGKGHLHGFTHTYLGATLIAMISALSGKYAGELGLRIIKEPHHLPITWPVAFLSAFMGTYSHVVLDSIMHADIEPFWPFNVANALQGIISIDALHIFCVITALAGGVLYFVIREYCEEKHSRQRTVQMKNWFITLLIYLLALIITMVISAAIAIVLIGPHSSMLPNFLHIPIGILLWINVFVTPVILAKYWHQRRKTKP